MLKRLINLFLLPIRVIWYNILLLDYNAGGYMPLEVKAKEDDLREFKEKYLK